MRDAAADLDFEKAARLRDEIKRLKAVELAAMDDPIAKQEAKNTESGGGNRKGAAGTQLPLEGGGRAARAGGGDSAATAKDHPTPDLRSDPPPQGEGAPRISPSGRNKSGTPEGKGSYFSKPSLDDMGPGTDGAVPMPKGTSSTPHGEEAQRPVSNPEAQTSYFRKNTLDEMTVGRTEKPVTGKLPEKPKPASPPNSQIVGEDSSPQQAKPIGEANLVRGSDDPRPIIRARSGAGSYEDPMDQKRKGRTKGKTGRPGR
jgi:excinuclease ABC subunit B